MSSTQDSLYIPRASRNCCSGSQAFLGCHLFYTRAIFQETSTPTNLHKQRTLSEANLKQLYFTNKTLPNDPIILLLLLESPPYYRPSFYMNRHSIITSVFFMNFYSIITSIFIWIATHHHPKLYMNRYHIIDQIFIWIATPLWPQFLHEFPPHYGPNFYTNSHPIIALVYTWIATALWP